MAYFQTPKHTARGAGMATTARPTIADIGDAIAARLPALTNAPRVRGSDVAEDRHLRRCDALPVGGESQLFEVGESRVICWGIDRMLHR